MIFTTPVELPAGTMEISHRSRLLLIGSCFADNIGRCDLWGGSYATIRQSLKHLRDYDGTLTIYPGHGDDNKLSKALDNTMYI